MANKIWELHGLALGDTIRSTPDGEADVAGLVLSEKAYLLAVRDFRPAQLVSMVRGHGPGSAAASLVEHYSHPDSLHATCGRGLVSTRGMGGPVLRRSDEVTAEASAGGLRRS